jgi:RNA polymerase sigma-70 factor (ECF subfamily)
MDEERDRGPQPDPFAAARQKWPALVLERSILATYLQARAIDGSRLAPEIAEDLYLACACLHDVPQALRIFRDRYGALIASVAHRFNPSPAFADEVIQRLSERLFVRGDDPKIARYAGKGPLSGFVTTAAQRIAFRLAQDARRFAGSLSAVDHLLAVDDQERLVLKERYREIFNRHLSVALRGLDRRDRLILRLNMIEHVSTTKIACMYNVNQSTVSRWIQRAVNQIVETIKKLVFAELGLDTQGMESAFALVRSQLEVGLSVVSQEDDAKKPPSDEADPSDRSRK